jgi:hypothetical protein
MTLNNRSLKLRSAACRNLSSPWLQYSLLRKSNPACSALGLLITARRQAGEGGKPGVLQSLTQGDMILDRQKQTQASFSG